MKKLMFLITLLFVAGTIITNAQTNNTQAGSDAKLEYVGDENVNNVHPVTKSDGQVQKNATTTSKPKSHCGGKSKGKACCSKKKMKTCAGHAKKCKGKSAKECKKTCKEHAKKNNRSACKHKHTESK